MRDTGKQGETYHSGEERSATETIEGAAKHQQRAHALTRRGVVELGRAFAEVRAATFSPRTRLAITPRAMRHIGRGNAERFSRRLARA